MAELYNINGICRCCHSKSAFKSLNDTYFYEGREEIFLNMLQQAFSIDIKPASEATAAFSICEVCVPRLCDAFLFHQQVVACEQTFYQYCNTHHKDVYNKDIKVEVNEVRNEVKEEFQFNQNQDSSDQKFDDGK
ncbi:uncharacterized protein LOC123668274 [Melitaea cinxia]|uniref:uncharacterized protein LOC123668274 n=1 Tax=Melitaea cinxia TaxID=113334 RepID=UPI001E272E3B|nr:uncharacterized protein LOC123668274 [Melitaea cinxia]